MVTSLKKPSVFYLYVQFHIIITLSLDCSNYVFVLASSNPSF